MTELGIRLAQIIGKALHFFHIKIFKTAYQKIRIFILRGDPAYAADAIRKQDHLKPVAHLTHIRTVKESPVNGDPVQPVGRFFNRNVRRQIFSDRRIHTAGVDHKIGIKIPSLG